MKGGTDETAQNSRQTGNQNPLCQSFDIQEHAGNMFFYNIFFNLHSILTKTCIASSMGKTGYRSLVFLFGCDRAQLRKSRSFFEREGWRSFRSAFASI